MSFLNTLLGDINESAAELAYLEALKQQDYVSAVPLLRSAIAREDATAMTLYAVLLAFGRGVQPNREDAADWFRQAAVRGQPLGQTAFGACLAAGIGVPQDEEAAAYWLYRASCQGYGQAIDMLADLALKSPRIVGPHFNKTQFADLLRKSHRPVASRVN